MTSDGREKGRGRGRRGIPAFLPFEIFRTKPPENLQKLGRIFLLARVSERK